MYGLQETCLGKSSQFVQNNVGSRKIIFQHRESVFISILAVEAYTTKQRD